MLIIEIALGIVLAVVILAFWPVIVGFGVALIVAGIALAAAAVTAMYLYEKPEIAGVILLVGLVGYGIHWDQNRKTFKRPEPLQGADGQNKDSMPHRPGD